MYIYIYIYIIIISELVGLALQFVTRNCVCCYSKLNLDRKFYAEVATHLPHIKLRTPNALNIMLS